MKKLEFPTCLKIIEQVIIFRNKNKSKHPRKNPNQSWKQDASDCQMQFGARGPGFAPRWLLLRFSYKEKGRNLPVTTFGSISY